MPTNTPLQDDLSFLRTLAERGLDTPLMAGPYLIAGGSWFAAASLIQVYDAATGLLTVLAGVPRGWGSDWRDFAWG